MARLAAFILAAFLFVGCATAYPRAPPMLAVEPPPDDVHMTEIDDQADAPHHMHPAEHKMVDHMMESNGRADVPSHMHPMEHKMDHLMKKKFMHLMRKKAIKHHNMRDHDGDDDGGDYDDDNMHVGRHNKNHPMKKFMHLLRKAGRRHHDMRDHDGDDNMHADRHSMNHLMKKKFMHLMRKKAIKHPKMRHHSKPRRPTRHFAVHHPMNNEMHHANIPGMAHHPMNKEMHAAAERVMAHHAMKRDMHQAAEREMAHHAMKREMHQAAEREMARKQGMRQHTDKVYAHHVMNPDMHGSSDPGMNMESMRHAALRNTEQAMPLQPSRHVAVHYPMNNAQSQETEGGMASPLIRHVAIYHPMGSRSAPDAMPLMSFGPVEDESMETITHTSSMKSYHSNSGSDSSSTTSTSIVKEDGRMGFMPPMPFGPGPVIPVDRLASATPIKFMPTKNLTPSHNVQMSQHKMQTTAKPAYLHAADHPGHHTAKQTTHTCPPNQEFSTCGTACPETCAGASMMCTRQCVIGCRCKSGFILHKGACIPRTQCPTDTKPKSVPMTSLTPSSNAKMSQHKMQTTAKPAYLHAADHPGHHTAKHVKSVNTILEHTSSSMKDTVVNFGNLASSHASPPSSHGAAASSHTSLNGATSVNTMLKQTSSSLKDTVVNFGNLASSHASPPSSHGAAASSHTSLNGVKSVNTMLEHTSSSMKDTQVNMGSGHSSYGAAAGSHTSLNGATSVNTMLKQTSSSMKDTQVNMASGHSSNSAAAGSHTSSNAADHVHDLEIDDSADTPHHTSSQQAKQATPTAYQQPTLY